MPEVNLKMVLFKAILREMMEEKYEKYSPEEIVAIAEGAIGCYKNTITLNQLKDMTKNQIIAIAKSLGLSYSGDNDDGEPEFVGNDEQWEKFNEVDTAEVIEDGDFTGACGTNDR